jgi:hypothetical protein
MAKVDARFSLPSLPSMRGEEGSKMANETQQRGRPRSEINIEEVIRVLNARYKMQNVAQHFQVGQAELLCLDGHCQDLETVCPFTTTPAMKVYLFSGAPQNLV